MSIKAYFESNRPSKAGIKQEFLAAVDESFKDGIEVVKVCEGYENVPDMVEFETDKDTEAMITEAKWFLSGRFDSCGVVETLPGE